MKNYSVFVRDHSISMRGLAAQAAKDYNSQIASVREAALSGGIDSVVSVVRCAVTVNGGLGCDFETRNSSVNSLRPLVNYPTPGGGTPLYDAVGMAIESFKTVPDFNDPNVSFLVMVITDGQENSSRKWSASALRNEIQSLIASDRWTFVFRVPTGYKRDLIRNLGLYEGNVLEWDQTDKGFQQATVQTTSAVSSYYTNLSRGIKSTSKFFVNTASLRPEALKQSLTNINKEVYFHTVPREMEIKEFFEKVLHQSFAQGIGYYQLTKTEKVQPQKEIAIQNRDTGEVYSGYQARDLLGIPHGEHIKLVPGSFGQYNVFIQSTSTNRKLVPGTKVLVRNR